MNRTLALSLCLGVGLAIGVTATMTQATRSTAPQSGGDLAPVPSSPQRSAVDVLEAHPFSLETSETHWMRAEADAYDRGMLLVIEADPELLIPRQGYENPMYVGAETAEPLNVGMFSGRRVVIVPGDVDLASSPVFFGEPELPERVTRAEAQRQLQLALDAGAGIDGTFELGQSKVFADGYELRRFGADLIEAHSPGEIDVITGLRAKRL